MALSGQRRKELAFALNDGWKYLRRTGNDHHIIAKGGHQVTTASTGNTGGRDVKAISKVRRCEQGLCDCPTDIPASEVGKKEKPTLPSISHITRTHTGVSFTLSIPALGKTHVIDMNTKQATWEGEVIDEKRAPVLADPASHSMVVGDLSLQVNLSRALEVAQKPAPNPHQEKTQVATIATPRPEWITANTARTLLRTSTAGLGKIKGLNWRVDEKTGRKQYLKSSVEEVLAQRQAKGLSLPRDSEKPKKEKHVTPVAQSIIDKPIMGGVKHTAPNPPSNDPFILRWGTLSGAVKAHAHHLPESARNELISQLNDVERILVDKGLL